MKILIIGGDGMLGHQLYAYYKNKYDTKVTLRQPFANYQHYELFNSNDCYCNVDIKRIEDLIPVISAFQPNIVINAVGVVKQRKDAKEYIPSLEINALFPHKLAQLCEMTNAKLIHISTDCVFDGKRGEYTEDDFSNAEDIYGKTKYLGEVGYGNALTIRTSIIGLELSRKTSLIEWFLAQTGNIKGFTRAIYSGLTTIEMARVIEKVFTSFPELSGLWHVTSDAINKYDLLTIFADKLGKNDVVISANDVFFCDRSMLSNKFRKQINYAPPSWEQMLEELAEQVHARKKNVIAG